MPEPKLLWIDLESTGTDEHRDPIIEIGVLLSDHDLTNRTESRSWVAQAEPSQLERMSDYVRDMHTTNGLLKDIHEPNTPTLQEAEAQLIEWLSQYGSKHDFVLAGSGVGHFDRKFINAQMPELTKWLRYYCMDVGVLRRALLWIGHKDKLMNPPENGKSHRARDDIELHYRELCTIKERLDAGKAAEVTAK